MSAAREIRERDIYRTRLSENRGFFTVDDKP
jgi:hypothetical protein